MNLLVIALILGVVEGLTEFLPVSSTGHLVVAADLLGFHGETAQAFEVVIQFGAIFAAIILYRERFLGLIPGRKSTSPTPLRGLNGWLIIALGCVPALFLGALFYKKIKALLFAPGPVALAFVLGGIVMLLIEKRNLPQQKTLQHLNARDALIIGCVQAIALWPGVSRSGATIIAALLLGYGRVAAAEFSFLLAVPLLCAASAHDLYKHSELFSGTNAQMLAVGFVAAFISALAAIRAFIAALSHCTLRPFAWYRIAVGLLILCVGFSS